MRSDLHKTKTSATTTRVRAIVIAIALCLPATLAASGGAVGQPTFDNPLGLATNGSLVWVANTASNSVSELNSSNDSLVRSVSLAADGLDSPIAIAVNRTNVWIANKAGNSLTELNVKTVHLSGLCLEQSTDFLTRSASRSRGHTCGLSVREMR